MDLQGDENSTIPRMQSQTDMSNYEIIEVVALDDSKSTKAANVLTRREHILSHDPYDQGKHASRVQEAIAALCSITSWFPALTSEIIKADFIAGLTVGVMVIPQSMSYANIAGLPYVVGMYSAFIPTLVYAFVGGSRQLAVGPVAMVSLLVADGLGDLLSEKECPAYFDGLGNPDKLSKAELCPDEYIKLAVLCSLVVGLIQLAGGLMQLGFLVTFLGHPVVSGFTSGAAIIIGLSQLKYILGFDVPKSQYIYETVGYMIKDIGEFQFMCFILGGVSLVALWLMRQYLPRNYPKLKMLRPLGPLIVCIFGIILSASCGYTLEHDFKVKIIGDIPSGFPPISVSGWNMGQLNKVIPTAISASLIGYMESIAIGKSLAAKHSYELDAGQEMFALGLANLAGSVFTCYPVTGSFSRSAVNNSTGAKSQLAGLITSVIMFLTLMVLTPLFYYLPKYVLAAIVINSVTNLIAIDDARQLWVIDKKDWGLWVFAFLGTLFLGIQLALMLSVGISLIIVIYQSVRPQMAVLWRLPDTEIYRNVKQESDGRFISNCLIVRIGAPMYFANSGYVKDMILRYISDLEEINPVLYVICEMTPVISVDSTAVHSLEDIQKDLRTRGIRLVLCNVGNRVKPVLERAGLTKIIGGKDFIDHPTVHSAVLFCMRHKQNKTSHSSEDSTLLSPITHIKSDEERNCETTPTSDRMPSGELLHRRTQSAEDIGI